MSANVKNYGLSATSNSIELGKGGQKISSNGSTFGVYEHDGVTLTNIQVKNAAANQDAVALLQMTTAISNAIGRLTSGLVYKGVYDAATEAAKVEPQIPALPASPTVGDFWKVSSSGTVLGLELAIGDMIIANATIVGATIASNWDKVDNTEATDILRTSNISATADLASTAGGIDSKLAARSVTATYINNQVSNNAAAVLVGAVYSKTVDLNYNSTSPVNIGTALPANATILKAYVKVSTAFDGTLPTVTIGYSGSTTIVADVGDSDLATLGTYEITSIVNSATSKQYIATYTRGASANGAATIILQYTNGVQV